MGDRAATQRLADQLRQRHLVVQLRERSLDRGASLVHFVAGGGQRVTRVADDVTGHASGLHVGARGRWIEKSFMSLVLGSRRRAADPHVGGDAILRVEERPVLIASARIRCASIFHVGFHVGDRCRPHRPSLILADGRLGGRVPDRRIWLRSVAPSGIAAIPR